MDDIEDLLRHSFAAIDQAGLRRRLFAELATWLVTFVALGGINCLLLDVAYDDALNFWTSLSIFAH